MLLKLLNLGQIIPRNLILSREFLVQEKNVNSMQFRFKSFKKLLDYSKVPVLDEKDLEEQFVLGSGPGGQCINRTASCVVLKHKPTGIVVKNQETRSLLQNQKLAREIMIQRLDKFFNKEESIENQTNVLMKDVILSRKRKQKKWAELKKNFKEREGLT
ncbi:mitochondrial translation release factor in rescue [Leptopilina heterotoma]|uniref:mitochondrial translation release factor in rescue n=1 Tax=Leptopilina heterotoma TaxID=63436 RepID=UPI001CA8BAD2|nr:mitochondrial translation release factor in rescue [Leptopilina heterotoma]